MRQATGFVAHAAECISRLHDIAPLQIEGRVAGLSGLVIDVDGLAGHVAVGDQLLLARRAAPPVLAVRGGADIFAQAAVAIVGSRNASAAGLTFADRLARGLGQAGYAIVSGLARGIDQRAHAASIETGAIAVLAGGHAKPYPPEATPMIARIIERGAVISEMPIEWEPRGRDFPRRNRIVSGMALGTVVIEAARGSGSLITARFALEQGREVFAVPGSPLDPRCKGTNRLIRDGATLVETADDILREISPQLGAPFAERQRAAFAPAPTAEIGPKDLADAREIVLGLLSPTPLPVDELLRQCQMSPAVILTIVLELELAGRVARQPGNALTLI